MTSCTPEYVSPAAPAPQRGDEKRRALWRLAWPSLYEEVRSSDLGPELRDVLIGRMEELQEGEPAGLRALLIEQGDERGAPAGWEWALGCGWQRCYRDGRVGWVEPEEARGDEARRPGWSAELLSAALDEDQHPEVQRRHPRLEDGAPPPQPSRLPALLAMLLVDAWAFRFPAGEPAPRPVSGGMMRLVELLPLDAPYGGCDVRRELKEYLRYGVDGLRQAAAAVEGDPGAERMLLEVIADGVVDDLVAALAEDIEPVAVAARDAALVERHEELEAGGWVAP